MFSFLSDEKNKTYLAAIFVFLIVMGIYLKTLNPSIWWEDSGELTTSPYTLGITHPPGYPLYTFVTKVVMTLIPVSNIGFRGNMANAYWGGLSAVFIFLIVLKIEKKLIETKKIDPKILFGGYLPAIVASILSSIAATTWLYSITSEEYTLNLLFMMLVSFIFFIWEEKKDIRYMFCASFIYGLSFAHHQQAVMFFLPFLYFGTVISLKNTSDWKNFTILLTLAFFGVIGYFIKPIACVPFILAFGYFTTVIDSKTIFHWKNFAIILAMFILGWSAYLYMPIRSGQHPLLNWGTPYQWEGFQFSVKRDQYGPMNISRNLKTWIAQLNRLGFIEQFNIYIFPLSFIGLYRMIRKNSTHTVFLLLATVCSGLFFVWITNLPDPGHMIHLFRKFLIPLYTLAAIWITYGLCFILEKIYHLINKVKPINQNIWAFSLIPFLLIPVSNLSAHYKTYDYHKSYFTYDYVYNMANTLEKNSVVWGFLSNDTFNWWFYNFAEGRRLDVINIHQRMVTLPWYYEQTKDNYPQAVMRHNEFLDWKLRQDLIYRSVVFTRDFMIDNPGRNYYYTFFSKGYLPKRYALVQKGILFRDYGGKNDKPFDEKVWLNYRYRGINSSKIPRCERDKDILGFVATLHSFFGQKYMQEGKYELAIYHFQILAQIDPGSPHLLYSLGYAYTKINKQASSIREFKKFLKIADPRSLEALNVKKWLETVQPRAM